MRVRRGLLSLLVGAAVSIGSSASAFVMDWTLVGNLGNACDPQPGPNCFGTVGYAYQIGTYEVTNAQYTEFLNAKAATDPLGLYNTNMGTSDPIFGGGIIRIGSSGNYTYRTIAGRADMPVNFVSFYDAVRFANWMSNGQGSGNTETGAYTLDGGTPTPNNSATVIRNQGAGATIFVASEDEWYKAAYYNSSTASYFDYPARSDTPTTCTTPTATPNAASCSTPQGYWPPRNKGSYTGSASPYGTFDQGGNLFEWNDTIVSNVRGIRGGSFDNSAAFLSASSRQYHDGALEFYHLGFRVANAHVDCGTGLGLGPQFSVRANCKNSSQCAVIDLKTALPIRVAAQNCNFDHFNFGQVVMRDDDLDDCYSSNPPPDCEGMRIRDQFGFFTKYPVLPHWQEPPYTKYVDPPNGGYKYEYDKHQSEDDRSPYWNEVACRDNGYKCTMISSTDVAEESRVTFMDIPRSHKRLKFVTELLGVGVGGGTAELVNVPGMQTIFVWEYTGEKLGGLIIPLRASPPDDASNTGDIELIGAYELSDVPLDVATVLPEPGRAVSLLTLVPFVFGLGHRRRRAN